MRGQLGPDTNFTWQVWTKITIYYKVNEEKHKKWRGQNIRWPPHIRKWGAMAPWLPPLPTPLNFTYLHIGLEERQASLIKIISHGLINRNKISRYLIWFNRNPQVTISSRKRKDIRSKIGIAIGKTNLSDKLFTELNLACRS